MPTSTSANAPLGKALASNDKKTRDKAVKSLRTFLSCGQPLDIEPSPASSLGEADWQHEIALEARFSPLELQKLWKALFFCMWMSDKPLVQQKLADDLADLLLVVRTAKADGRVARVKSALAFLEAFWHIVIREWSGLDRLRMDKYYRLLRRYMVASFKLLQREHWDRQAVRRFNAILSGDAGPLNSSNPKLLLSILSHVAEIYPSSLAEAVSSSESDQNDATTAPIPIIDLLQPAITGLCHASQKAHFTAVHDQLLQPFLVACDQLSESEQRSKKRRKVVHAEEQPTDDGTDWQLVLQQPLCDLDGEPLAAELVPSQLLKLLFAAASKPEVSDANRRRLYQICRERTSDEDQSI